MHSKKIVVITTPGSAKRDFVNTLHLKTDGGIALVVVQKGKQEKLFVRIKKFYRKVPWFQFPLELYHFIIMATSKKRRGALGFAKHRSPVSPSYDQYLPPSLIVDDVNSEDVEHALQKIQPHLIVIWGGLIVRDHIIKIAKKVLNMHLGYCPYYRGTNCNFHAILNHDFSHIGITIHEAIAEVDAGRIYAVVSVDTKRPPKAFFRDLNDRAVTTYVQICAKLHEGEHLETYAQDLSLGKNHKLKEWTYAKQHAVANMLLALDRQDGDTGVYKDQ